MSKFQLYSFQFACMQCPPNQQPGARGQESVGASESGCPTGAAGLDGKLTCIRN